MSSLIKTSSLSAPAVESQIFRTVQPHDMIEFIYMSSEGFTGRPRAVSSEEFRYACGRFATGVTIATVLDAEQQPRGLTVSSFTSVSLIPPLISICLGHAVSLIDLFRDASFFGINILAGDQQSLSERFARKGLDRFEGVGWTLGAYNVPLIDGVLAAIECQVDQRFPVGDHDIFVGRMVSTRVREGAPLLHFSGKYRKLQL
jgi:flavin reductase (DIM6/NTAB) family NADH-FMN oxidoreductase RutF